MLYLKIYISTLFLFLLIDGLWLGFVARSYYQNQLGDLLSDNPNWTAAILFYLLFVGGLIIFSICPALQIGSAGRAALLGALFGLMTYATYDLTNLATIRGWPIMVTVVDLTWGTFLGGLVSTFGYYAGTFIKGS